MRNKHAIKENQVRRRLLHFSLFTLGGIGLEGSCLPIKEENSRKKPDAIA